ncbi:S8 family serine peptidase [Micromonospora sp. NPDC052213]|uniref:S8 family serine peptidase n=1 Tax=Micromonospora sp. NPDC052213 TaxID=3155812 RepID=UPI00343889FF
MKQASRRGAPEWGVTKIGADKVWNEHHTRGEGVVVASLDTGVQFDHPALVNSYRGNGGGKAFDHAYNWFDPSGGCAAAPCDTQSHGTHTVGTTVGGDRAGNRIGVAPGATWIAARGALTLNIDTTGLTAGRYTTELVVRNNSGRSPVLRIPVALTVT